VLCQVHATCDAATRTEHQTNQKLPQHGARSIDNFSDI